MNVELDGLAARHSFSGVVGIERDGSFSRWAFGLADRAHEVANTVEHRFGVASGVKTLTAVAALSVAADGLLDLDAPVREWLGDSLPLVDDRVTPRLLLHHRSGMGDYFSEDANTAKLDYLMRVPLHTLDGSRGYLAALDGFPQKFVPDAEFSYCNSGYVLLAVLLERATAMAYHDVIAERVTVPAGMTGTEFLRMDSLPGDAAVGYLHPDGLQTNVLHLPVVGFGDGGIFTTVGDIHRLWAALTDGRFGDDLASTMATPPTVDGRYGMGLWLDGPPGSMSMEGMDAGASFRSTRYADGTTFSVLSNTTDGAWPIAEYLAKVLEDAT